MVPKVHVCCTVRIIIIAIKCIIITYVLVYTFISDGYYDYMCIALMSVYVYTTYMYNYTYTHHHMFTSLIPMQAPLQNVLSHSQRIYSRISILYYCIIIIML